MGEYPPSVRNSPPPPPTLLLHEERAPTSFTLLPNPIFITPNTSQRVQKRSEALCVFFYSPIPPVLFLFPLSRTSSKLRFLPNAFPLTLSWTSKAPGLVIPLGQKLSPTFFVSLNSTFEKINSSSFIVRSFYAKDFWVSLPAATMRST